VNGNVSNGSGEGGSQRILLGSLLFAVILGVLARECPGLFEDAYIHRFVGLDNADGVGEDT
jgi:hypothetical protein